MRYCKRHPAPHPGCYQLLINDTIQMEYLDLTVGMLSQLGTPTAAAGLILNFQDLGNFYAVIVYPASNMLKAYRFDNGNPVLIEEHEVIPKKRTPWHFLRVQRNTIVSKDFFEISFDNQFFPFRLRLYLADGPDRAHDHRGTENSLSIICAPWNW